MHALVIGHRGMLGTDLMHHLAAEGHHAVGLDLPELDITDRRAVMRAVGEAAPEVVFHLAAWTDVDGAEQDEEQALRVNGEGTRNVAIAARDAGAALVAVSTDYVFPGTGGPYAEDDATDPIQAYGRTKLAGERLAELEHPEGTRIGRTAWLYGAHGRNFVDTMIGLGSDPARDHVDVVADQVGCPTWTRDLCPALVALADQPAGIYHVAGGGSTTWADFAREAYRLAGVECEVRDTTTEAFARPAPRPAVSVLEVTHEGAPRLRAWEDALADYIRERS
ncbi:MAG: dTDP-4-dehydrorhamnose reductase [Actinobacteria bacterium]|nr:dTDP-4-dehydrorhamnose reductase [Actinomycetota bacterium]MBM3697114.1 dTDP-4-dehydrorhamnose reductase [Actinomycetota bacterium]